MDSVLKLGKYTFALPFAVFGVMHFMAAEDMASMAPFGGVFIIYLTGVALIAASISILIGKLDKLAATLLGVFLILTALLVHAKNMGSEDQMQAAIATTGFLKDLALSGAAWLYAAYLSKDKAVIG